MAIYSLNLGFISRSEGRSAVGFSAYIAGSKAQDLRTGVTHDYGCKEDVIVSRVLAPEGSPDWAKNPSILWNKAEQFEDDMASLRFRGDTHDQDKNQRSLRAKEKFLASSQTAQTIMGAIPIEFSKGEAELCVEEFLKDRFVSRGLVVEYAIHWDRGNPHFHGLITRRALVEGEFSQRKDRDIVSKPELMVTRKQWEEIANKHLELSGHEVRIDSRSHADRGLLFLPMEHEGWYAQRLAELGHYSRIVADNDAIRQRNIEILCNNPATLIQELAQKRTVFTRQHLEDEIIRRVGGDEKLFCLLNAKVEGFEIPSEMILSRANDNFMGESAFGTQLQKTASAFTNRLLEDDGITHFVGENINREKVFTSFDYKKQEEKLLQLADTLHQRQTKSVSGESIATSIGNREAELGFELSEEQKSAITHLCSGPDICILNGKAGTGKTTLLKAVAEAYEQSGYRVLGTSFQGKAVEIMEQEIGIACKTLDSFQHSWTTYQSQKDLVESGKLWGRAYGYAQDRIKELEQHRFTEKDVIIVDEANMIGGRLWEPFLAEAADKGAKVLIVQDPAQIKSRDPGDYGRLFAERFGFRETAQVMRQRVPWQRECSKLLNDHQVLDGLKPYFDQGHMTWHNRGELVTHNLTQAYVKDFMENPAQSRITLAYRNVEVYELNQSIRKALKTHGSLQNSFFIHGEEYAIGDRVRFTQNDHHGAYVKNVLETDPQFKGVKNGTFGTVEDYDEDKSLLNVCLDGNRRVQFNINEYQHITHGYAMGIHKSEGSTFDRSFVSLDPLLDPSTLLVAMTRHRQDLQVFVNREQFADFKDVVDRTGRASQKQSLQDYHISEEQKAYFQNVQQYRNLMVEGATLREEMEGGLNPSEALYKHASYPAYQSCFEEKKRVASDILKDWKNHAPYVKLAGIRKDVLEVEAGLRPRLLSDLEHRASIQVQGYMDLVNETRGLWKTISETHPGVLANAHELYKSYKAKKTERDSLASVFQENPRLYNSFFRVTKDEAGNTRDYWGDVVTTEIRVYQAAIKTHAAAHQRSQAQKLFYDRLSPDQKVYYDEVKAYVDVRNEAAAIYGLIRKQQETPLDTISATGSPGTDLSATAITLQKFHQSRAKRDALALKLVESPEKYLPFFSALSIKEEKLLSHAVSGEIRAKVQTYAQETDIAKRASQAAELKRILTTSNDYRIFKESGLEVKRLAIDIAAIEKPKDKEHSLTQPTQSPKTIPSTPEDLKERASLLNTISELHMKSTPLEGTVAESYLRQEQKLTEAFSADLRYLPKGTTFMEQGERKTLSHACLVAFARNQNGNLNGVQLTKLTENGKHVPAPANKPDKIQYGTVTGSLKDYVKPFDVNKGLQSDPKLQSQNTVQPTKIPSSSTEQTNSMEIISSYIAEKIREIKAYEGTALARAAKQELRSYLQALQKDERLLQDFKTRSPELVKDIKRLYQEQAQEQEHIRSKTFDRGIEM
ncbi:MAG: MobA/MobL family protein [Alphaproteobacteria bacterium]|nr:MobA/MobL family protein [Alphaproteobacteria bacterium]